MRIEPIEIPSSASITISEVCVQTYHVFPLPPLFGVLELVDVADDPLPVVVDAAPFAAQ